MIRWSDGAFGCNVSVRNPSKIADVVAVVVMPRQGFNGVALSVKSDLLDRAFAFALSPIRRLFKGLAKLIGTLCVVIGIRHWHLRTHLLSPLI
jgi:hypothetical protein